MNHDVSPSITTAAVDYLQKEKRLKGDRERERERCKEREREAMRETEIE